MMRKIDLIVIHCSATRADRSLTRMTWRCNTVGVDLTEQVITTTSARMEQCTYPARGTHRSTRQRFQRSLDRYSAMKVVWTAGTPGRYPDPGTAGYAPATRRATTGEIFRLPGLRTPGSFAGLERKR